MRTFLAVVAGVGMFVAGLGLLASLPAESLPLAGASFGGIILSGILWMLTEISERLRRESSVMKAADVIIDDLPEPSPSQLAAEKRERTRRFLMIGACVMILAVCIAVVFLHH
jgi:hypothetical protein